MVFGDKGKRENSCKMVKGEGAVMKGIILAGG